MRKLLIVGSVLTLALVLGASSAAPRAEARSSPCALAPPTPVAIMPAVALNEVPALDGAASGATLTVNYSISIPALRAALVAPKAVPRSSQGNISSTVISDEDRLGLLSPCFGAGTTANGTCTGAKHLRL